MLPSKLPAHARRALFLNTAAINAELELTQDGRRLLANKAIAFVDINTADFDDPILAQLSNRGLIEEGTLLVQSPTNQLSYERLRETVRTAVLDRIETTVSVCQELGARELRITHFERGTLAEQASTRIEIDPDVMGVPVQLFGAEVAKSTAEISVAGLEIQTSWSFRGGEPNVGLATDALRQSGLHDESLERMINLFRSANRPFHHTIQISTESDMRRVSDLLVDINAPFTKIMTEIERFKHASSIMRLRMSIEFGERNMANARK